MKTTMTFENGQVLQVIFTDGTLGSKSIITKVTDKMVQFDNNKHNKLSITTLEEYIKEGYYKIVK